MVEPALHGHDRAQFALLRQVVRRTAFPVMLIGALGIGLVLLRLTTLPDPWVVFTITLACTLPIAFLQQWLPYEPRWRGTPKDWAVDTLHVLLSIGVSTAILRAIGLGALLALSDRVEGWLGWSLWPNWLPVLVQLAIGVVLGDLGSYISHRICHENRHMWRVHALHHSVDRMYVLASARTHPLNALLSYVARTVPLVFLGAGPEVLVLHACFTSAIGLMQHSNVDFRTGALSWLISTPDLHRWHHADNMEDGNHNYGTDTAVWDIVFGTRYLPHDREPRAVGLPDYHVPPNYFHHIGFPVRIANYLLKR